MSHWLEIEAKVRDLKFFKKACENLGISFSEKEKVSHSTWAGDIDCDAIFKDTKGGEGALVKEKDTEDYGIVWDNYANTLVDVVGENCEKLMMEYTTEVVKNQIDQVGMLTNQQMAVDGSRILEGVFL